MISNVPVIATGGLLRGSLWTLYPFSSYWRGTHEIPTQEAIRRCAPWAGKCVWDLGAHFGFYSIALAKLVGPTGEVAAFEPNPQAFRKLERHTRLNRLKHLKLFQLAASDSDARLPLIHHRDPWTTTGHLPYQGESIPGDADLVWIQSARIDDLVAAGRLRAPSFIKIDVEGHAGQALSGARATLLRSRPDFFISFHSPQEVAGVMEIVRPMGYHAEDLERRAFDLAQIGVGTECFLVPPS